jgi:L-fuculose-phosphate aldolase
MIFMRERQLKKEIIDIAKTLYGLRLIAGSSGNLSARIDKNNILVTVTGSSLGSLRYKDIIKVNLTQEENLKNKRLTSEFPLHSSIYKNFPAQVIIHCHPALANGYFTVYSDLKILTFETKLYLGNLPVIEQDTPSVTKPERIIEALKINNLVILKNHGVVCMGDDFKTALGLIETLEEAIKTAALARLFKSQILDDLDRQLKETLTSDKVYAMFSEEHIQAIVDLVNKDEFIQKKGQELDLTLEYAIKLDNSDKVYKFIFEKGKITKLEYDDFAPFVASAPANIWEMIFLGKLDPFVATMQGKLKLKGELGRLSRWYVPFSRLFELFKQVKIK